VKEKVLGHKFYDSGIQVTELNTELQLVKSCAKFTAFNYCKTLNFVFTSWNYQI